MNALIYRGPGKRAWVSKPKPKLERATDAIVKLTRTTICGTDLHILKGDVPTVVEGRTLGHEGVGVIEEVGTAISVFKRLITHEFRLDELMAAYDTFGEAAKHKALKVIIRA